LFIIDGSKALAWAIRRSFGRNTAIQRCQILKAPNIMERLPKPPHTSRSAVHCAKPGSLMMLLRPND
jgi:putative transposase